MTDSTKTIGRSGESRASTHLQSLGFTIRDTNWRYRRYEIDIIAENQNFIVFVEVKTRKSDTFGRPEDFVSRKKQRFIISAANEYIKLNNIEKEARFDIVAITDDQIEYIPDAFYPLV
jgi:putative endonuclease